MKRKNIVVFFLITSLVAVILLMTGGFPLRAAQDDAAVLTKLNKVLQNQNAIISQIKEMKEELVKIRYRIRN